MMIVMKAAATEDEIQAVIERIEAVGARAHPSRGEEVTVIGAIGDREHIARLELEGAPGVDHVVPILKPYKLASSQLRIGERTVVEIDGRRIGGDHFSLIAGPVHGRVARPAADDGAHRARRRRLAAARRRLQAAHLALRLPGPRPGGPAAARRGQGRDRAADRHRADGRARPRAGARGGRRDPDRRPQHAELPAADRDRPLRPAGAAQARAVRDARGAADGGGVHPQGGQPERAAVRARDPHVRDRLPLHARPDRGAGAQGALAPAGDRRPEPRGRAGATSCCRCRWRPPPRAPTGSSSRSTPIPSTRSATGRRRSRRRRSRTTSSRSSGRPRSPARRSQPSALDRRGPRRRADRRVRRARRA